MKDLRRINEFFDFNNTENINRLRKAYNDLTTLAIKQVNESNGVDNDTALKNRDIVFFESLLKVLENKEKELGESFTPDEKNTIIERIIAMVNKE